MNPPTTGGISGSDAITSVLSSGSSMSSGSSVTGVCQAHRRRRYSDRNSVSARSECGSIRPSQAHLDHRSPRLTKAFQPRVPVRSDERSRHHAKLCLLPPAQWKITVRSAPSTSTAIIRITYSAASSLIGPMPSPLTVGPPPNRRLARGSRPPWAPSRRRSGTVTVGITGCALSFKQNIDARLNLPGPPLVLALLLSETIEP